MFCNRCASNRCGGCRRGCGCQCCCNWGSCGCDSNQITGTVTGYIPVTVSYTMTPTGDISNGFGMIEDPYANGGSGCGCGCNTSSSAASGCGCGFEASNTASGYGCGCQNMY